MLLTNTISKRLGKIQKVTATSTMLSEFFTQQGFDVVLIPSPPFSPTRLYCVSLEGLGRIVEVTTGGPYQKWKGEPVVTVRGSRYNMDNNKSFSLTEGRTFDWIAIEDKVWKSIELELKKGRGTAL